MSKIELPPLPEPAGWEYSFRNARHLAVHRVAGIRAEEVFTADQLRARDRQIVELCASIAREFRRGAGDPVCAEVAAAIRSLLDPAEKETK